MPKPKLKPEIQRVVDAVDMMNLEDQQECLAQLLHLTGLNPTVLEERVDELDELDEKEQG